jgi:hypothetical protein
MVTPRPLVEHYVKKICSTVGESVTRRACARRRCITERFDALNHQNDFVALRKEIDHFAEPLLARRLRLVRGRIRVVAVGVGNKEDIVSLPQKSWLTGAQSAATLDDAHVSNLAQLDPPARTLPRHSDLDPSVGGVEHGGDHVVIKARDRGGARPSTTLHARTRS